MPFLQKYLSLIKPEILFVYWIASQARLAGETWGGGVHTCSHMPYLLLRSVCNSLVSCKLLQSSFWQRILACVPADSRFVSASELAAEKCWEMNQNYLSCDICSSHYRDNISLGIVNFIQIVYLYLECCSEMARCHPDWPCKMRGCRWCSSSSSFPCCHRRRGHHSGVQFSTHFRF